MSLKGGFRSSGNGKLLAENDGKFFDEKKKKIFLLKKKVKKAEIEKAKNFCRKQRKRKFIKNKFSAFFRP